ESSMLISSLSFWLLATGLWSFGPLPQPLIFYLVPAEKIEARPQCPNRRSEPEASSQQLAASSQQLSKPQPPHGTPVRRYSRAGPCLLQYLRLKSGTTGCAA